MIAQGGLSAVSSQCQPVLRGRGLCWGSGLTLVSLLGLVVFWAVLGTRELVPGGKRFAGRFGELLLFWLVFSIHVPIFTAVAGLKTSTAYALGRRPRGHFVPMPK